jgi:hypothetical protein
VIDRPKPTAGCSANERRRHTATGICQTDTATCRSHYLVHLVSIIIRIFYDARTNERQTGHFVAFNLCDWISNTL